MPDNETPRAVEYRRCAVCGEFIHFGQSAYVTHKGTLVLVHQTPEKRCWLHLDRIPVHNKPR